MITIFDLDNCISDDNWRLPYINQRETGERKYDQYHMLAGFDQLAHASLLLGKRVVISTGRPVRYKPITEQWLLRNGIRAEIIIMRNEGDARDQVRIKRQHLVWLLSLYDYRREEIAHAYDDRVDVVAEYNSLGIPASVLAINKEQRR